MSSTNKTTNYNLSQFIGSDKPTYLGDYNSDMQKIDNAMKTNSDNIQTVASTANTASENANTALTNASNAQTTAENAQTSANTAQGVATNALEKSTQNESELSKFNFTNFDIYTSSQMSTTRGTLRSESKVQVATNDDGSIGKIYGNVMVDNVQTTTGQSNEFQVIIPNTKLRPSSLINITGCAIRAIYTSNGLNDFIVASYSIDTNGTLTLSLYSNPLVTSSRYTLIGCLLFLKDFGDQPAPEQ